MALMMPQAVHADCASQGERELFGRLRDDPGTEGWIVLHSLDIADHVRQVSGEADFVVLVPQLGVLVVEVKGCKRLRCQDGHWYYGDDAIPDRRGPFKQAAQAMHSLRKRLLKAHPELGHILFWSGVVFPYVPFSIDSEEWHPWQVIDANALRRQPISKALEGILKQARAFIVDKPSGRWFQIDNPEPTSEHCKVIADIFRPSFELYENPKDRAARREAEIKHFTQEQFVALDAMRANERVIFTGPAGTGKTLLAIEAAQRSQAQGKRVLLLCYNRFLGHWLADQVSDLSPLVVCKTMHRYMLDISGCDIRLESKTPKFWDEYVPTQAIETLLAAEVEPFDELIIDEAQDLIAHSNYLDVLDLCLEGSLRDGRWLFFGDFERQAIYRGLEEDVMGQLQNRAASVPIYSLRTNCRNSPRIAETVRLLGGLRQGYDRVLRPDNGIEPDLMFYSSLENQVECLCTILSSLYRQRYKGNEIAILSPKECSVAAAVDQTPWKDRLQPLYKAHGGQIGYTTIQAYKGLEKPVIIVTDFDEVVSDDAMSYFYIAITRAQERLIMLLHDSLNQDILNMLTQNLSTIHTEK